MELPNTHYVDRHCPIRKQDKTSQTAREIFPRIFSLVIFATFALSAPVFAGSLELVKESNNSFLLKGFSPGSTLAVLRGFAAGLVGAIPQISCDVSLVQDKDGNGTERFRVGVSSGYELVSAADLSSADSAWLRTLEKTEQLLVSPVALAADQAGKLTLGPFEAPPAILCVMLVRTGAAVWFARVYDGSAPDLDGHANGLVTLDPRGFRPLGAGRALESFLPGDRLYAVEIRGAQAFSWIVGGAQ
jgi:hypothetical protein